MRKHLSYANVVSTLALFLVLGGTAVAAKVIITKPSQLGKNVVTNKKVKKGTLSSNRLSAKARAALKGATGPAGFPGAPGAPGAPGTAKAYGSVDTDGTPSRTRGVNSVIESAGFAALYCVDTTAPVENVVATAQGGTGTVTAVVNYGTQQDCPATTDFTVRTLTAIGGLANGPFTFAAN